ncbi:50S ribosomal protein L7ae [uncultured Allobaculum sp.]|uniref:L7Ae/L30e/S12e/Gadd45 family ribosomal protein n=1 Tax=uncultured Allobaculum sp. TaxID=1187017 RepID=UPI00258C48DC|nr:50S ribosomal protein L7ae [uncultured Allobaculum sp.]
MPADATVSLLGLCIRAGKFAKGDALIPAISSRKAKAVVISSACGANRTKKLHDKCSFYSIPCYTLEADRYDQLGSKAGNSIAILDAGFARGIEKYLTPDPLTKREETQDGESLS